VCDEGMEGEDVNENRPEYQEAEIASAGNGDEDRANEFKHFDELEVTRGTHSAHVQCDRRAFLHRLRRDEIEQDDNAGHGEEQAEEDSGDGGRVFHRCGERRFVGDR